MKKHFIFITFVLSLVNMFTSYINGDVLSLLGWFTAALASLDHFITLKRNNL
jgi:hypothetical protein